MNTLENLRAKAVSYLLVVAKDLEVKNRHEMKKELLIANILEKENIKRATTFSNFLEKEADDEFKVMMKPEPAKKPKSDYIDQIKLGVMVAFKWSDDKTAEVISGKVIILLDKAYVVETRRGMKFCINRDAITWVKTGDRWPKPLYEELKARGYA